ncbi:carotenoid isomerooxygenase [Diaphorina citri]|uniref:Carotenoid isomerooxygenase n=1 Tax=Diaphorina citri TaxID=121845 RepID=A0A1S3D9D6_DIACI|nr:carotenoid isomerooxygenase [Diaphorina citri]
MNKRGRQVVDIARYFHHLDNDATIAALERRVENGDSIFDNVDAGVWFRDCHTEVDQPVQGTVEGVIPSWIDGVLIRNGPGSWNVGEESFDHLFDCSGLLHRFKISSGLVTYQCKFIKSESYIKNHAARRIVVTGFGTRFVPDPCASIFQRIATLFKPGSDNTLVSVYPIQDQVYALGDSNYMHRIDPATLDTLEKMDLARDVTILHQTSHPLTTSDGETFNLGVTLRPTGPRYCILQLNDVADHRVKLVTSVPVRWKFHPGYMHTFAMTPHYFIIVEQPLSISVPRLIKNSVTNRPLATCLKFFEKQSTIFHVLDKTTGSVNIHSTPRYAQMFRARPLRFRLDLASPRTAPTGKVRPSVICDVGCETPRMNGQHQGRPYTYFYAISADIDRDNPGTLIKVNVQNNTCKSWSQKDVYPSEPVFVATPNAVKEDEGVLLSVLLWSHHPTRVSLLVLNARTMQELGRVNFTTPTPVPKCLHGWYFPHERKDA